MFSRRASWEEIAERLTALYPSAPAALRAAVETADGRPRRGAQHVDPWLDQQVRRGAAREAASASGLAEVPFPPDGEDALRVYLPRELEDAPVEGVPAAAWEQARADAWADHGDALAEDREQWWAEQVDAEVDSLVRAWRSSAAGSTS
jgi:hypothetical protein